MHLLSLQAQHNLPIFTYFQLILWLSKLDFHTIFQEKYLVKQANLKNKEKTSRRRTDEKEEAKLEKEKKKKKKKDEVKCEEKEK